MLMARGSGRPRGYRRGAQSTRASVWPFDKQEADVDDKEEREMLLWTSRASQDSVLFTSYT